LKREAAPLHALQITGHRAIQEASYATASSRQITARLQLRWFIICLPTAQPALQPRDAGAESGKTAQEDALPGFALIQLGERIQ
jgi:hypothetical protein